MLLTDQEKDVIMEMHNKGCSNREIADKLARTQTCIAQYVNDYEFTKEIWRWKDYVHR